MNPSLQISPLRKEHQNLDAYRFILFESEKQLEYQKKLGFYKRLLLRVSSKLRSYGLIGVSGTVILPDGVYASLYYELSDWKTLNEKFEILNQIISVTSKLSVDYDEKEELLYSRLERGLIPYLDEYDYYLEDHFWSFLSNQIYSLNPTLVENIKGLKSCIRVLLKKIYHRFYRDIRGLFRRIIQFIFMRSDDDADVAYVSDFAESISLCNIFNYHHEKKRDTRKIIFS